MNNTLKSMGFGVALAVLAAVPAFSAETIKATVIDLSLIHI